MLIDAHNHLGGPDKGDGKSQSVSDILMAMDASGIEKAVVFPFNEADPGISFSRTNSFIAEAMHAHPDRLIGFCRLDPNAGKDAVSELMRSVSEMGLKGLKLHPSSQDFPLDHPALNDVLDLAQELGVPVIFDSGKRLSPPAGIAALAVRFPRLNIIMAHMNLYEESIAAAEGSPNIYLGTTGYFNLRRLGMAIARLGADRFVEGSDSPYISMRREMEKINETPGVSDESSHLILGGNIGSLLGLP